MKNKLHVTCTVPIQMHLKKKSEFFISIFFAAFIFQITTNLILESDFYIKCIHHQLLLLHNLNQAQAYFFASFNFSWSFNFTLILEKEFATINANIINRHDIIEPNEVTLFHNKARVLIWFESRWQIFWSSEHSCKSQVHKVK